MSQPTTSSLLSYKPTLSPEGDVLITNKFSVVNQNPCLVLPAKVVRITNIVIFIP